MAVIRGFVGGIAAALVAGVAVAGCAPVKMGAAAIVGDQRVTIANLDTEAGMLASAGKSYPTVFTLSQQQITQQTLSWLIRFKINERLASDSGITVSAAQAQQALDDIFKQVQQNSSGNVTLNEILVANGIAPNLASEVGRYQAIELRYLEAQNGGTLPAANSSAASAADSKLSHALCVTAKSLSIKVNPQFGQLDYAKYQVVNAPDIVSRPGGAAPSASSSAAAPAC